eukprot:6192240-Pleurochrysis_carterae.AAC.1
MDSAPAFCSCCPYFSQTTHVDDTIRWCILNQPTCKYFQSALWDSEKQWMLPTPKQSAQELTSADLTRVEQPVSCRCLEQNELYFNSSLIMCI